MTQHPVGVHHTHAMLLLQTGVHIKCASLCIALCPACHRAYPGTTATLLCLCTASCLCFCHSQPYATARCIAGGASLADVARKLLPRGLQLAAAAAGRARRRCPESACRCEPHVCLGYTFCFCSFVCLVGFFSRSALLGDVDAYLSSLQSVPPGCLHKALLDVGLYKALSSSWLLHPELHAAVFWCWCRAIRMLWRNARTAAVAAAAVTATTTHQAAMQSMVQCMPRAKQIAALRMRMTQQHRQMLK